jgi:hypothetical protein
MIKNTNISPCQWLKSVILATQEAEIRRILVQSQQVVYENLLWKKPNTKRAGRMVQVVKYLPSNHEALSSNPVPPSIQTLSITSSSYENLTYSELTYIHCSFM